MSNDPILRMLGLAKKAGRLEIGEEPVGAACRARQARLVLLASDAAPNTLRRAAHFGQAGEVLWLETPFSKAEMGLCLGRSSCAMAALTDAGFAASLVEKLAARDPARYQNAAQQLRVKADRVLQRQKEQRQHEKNLRQGKGHPWAPPPPPKEESPPPQRSKPRPPKQAGPAQARRPQDGPAPRGTKRGPGGRPLTGKFRHA